ncbi:NADH:flavin oxidoreductase/NADH oxidase family protein [Cytobacillus sp. IB215316]|uniref:NADH:flavin oxidoreductase/NADH oxidase family protein n=1 Tax=Cytobacillus sp. IB215316 TaxID=3097354 RepID=UPI002A0D9566|nr:NADH:flavin oxidoreductase/NADH oxidase family protein [Cytobacillus sp. IB215316]MDX8361651.1 NADH:flavin oxidoreductase/NADH oxidase family protein [Cytobacillus sp. IB215316]
MDSVLFKEFTLNNGIKIKNRFFKGAMSEALANKHHQPTEAIYHLYETWARGGTGIVVTGNVMVDRKALGETRNVVVEDESILPFLEKWAEKGTINDTHLWMQLNHPGKQAPKGVVKETVAPSAIPLHESLSRFFPHPREITGSEINDLIRRFGNSAKLAKKAGFTGVQIHGAHGYLISQFLSPRHNHRNDEWGGDIDGRMKFLIEIYREIRNQTGSFPISVKMNSADFMKAGFTEEEAMYVAKQLEKEGVDLLEISGGSYENPQMTGRNVKESTKVREAYFLDFAEKLRKTVHMPLCVTGGFRSTIGMENAIQSNATDFIGIARPLAVYPDLPRLIANKSLQEVVLPQKKIGVKGIDNKVPFEIIWYSQQMKRLGQGKKIKHNHPVWLSLLQAVLKNGKEAIQQQRIK